MRYINHFVISAITSLLLLGAATSAQNPATTSNQEKSILISGATVHIGNGKVINTGLVGIKNGKILMVSDATGIKINKTEYDTILYMDGKHLYPAFIAPNSTIGLSEIEAVRATNDFNEVGGYNPHVRALVAFNTDSKISPTVRTNGVLYVQATPRSGVISGTSSIMALEGWNWEDAVLKSDDGIHLNFPKYNKRSGWRAEAEPSNVNEKFDEQVNELRKFFTDAKAYSLTIPAEKNLRFEAMKNVYNNKQKLYIHAENLKDILSAMHLMQQLEIKKWVLVGGKDAWKITKELRENEISVMVNRVHDLPEREQEDVDLPYKLPYLLQKDSVLFCLENSGDMEAMNTRNLPFLAGTACTYGLTREQALSAITLNTAKILGIDKIVGSIEEGKLASLIVSSGDALDMRSNNVELALVEGKIIPLTNEQEVLYKKYTHKFKLEQK